jgi:MFS family permease
VPTALLALDAPVLAIATASLVASTGIVWADAVWHTILQQHIPEAAISRVSAIDWTGTLVLNPVGFAIVGPIAAGIGIRTTLIGSAGLTAASTLATLAVPSVRRLRNDEPLAEPAPAV